MGPTGRLRIELGGQDEHRGNAVLELANDIGCILPDRIASLWLYEGDELLHLAAKLAQACAQAIDGLFEERLQTFLQHAPGEEWPDSIVGKEGEQVIQAPLVGKNMLCIQLQQIEPFLFGPLWQQGGGVEMWGAVDL